MGMKYWALLAAKLLGAIAGGYYLWRGVRALLPPPRPFPYVGEPFGHDLLWTLAAGACFLVALGFLYLALLDQRYRCRVCLRRLRMPVETGSWSKMLQLGRPRIEYICPFGHGTLKVPALHISGLEQPDWKAHADIWRELESLEESKK